MKYKKTFQEETEPLRKEKSCGVIVIKKENKKNYVLLVHHNLGHWGIPKGHIEKGETEKEAAIREVIEETGIQSEIISDFRETITYSPKSNVLKDVVFFIGKALNYNIKPQLSEIQQVKWVEVTQGFNLITHATEKELLKKAICYIKE